MSSSGGSSAYHLPVTLLSCICPRAHHNAASFKKMTVLRLRGTKQAVPAKDRRGGHATGLAAAARMLLAAATARTFLQLIIMLLFVVVAHSAAHSTTRSKHDAVRRTTTVPSRFWRK